MGRDNFSNNWVSSNLGFCLRASFNVCKIMNKLTIGYANEEKRTPLQDRWDNSQEGSNF